MYADGRINDAGKCSLGVKMTYFLVLVYSPPYACMSGMR
jgi:hypothetical protein